MVELHSGILEDVQYGVGIDKYHDKCGLTLLFIERKKLSILPCVADQVRFVDLEVK